LKISIRCFFQKQILSRGNEIRPLSICVSCPTPKRLLWKKKRSAKVKVWVCISTKLVIGQVSCPTLTISSRTLLDARVSRRLAPSPLGPHCIRKEARSFHQFRYLPGVKPNRDAAAFSRARVRQEGILDHFRVRTRVGDVGARGSIIFTYSLHTFWSNFRRDVRP